MADSAGNLRRDPGQHARFEELFVESFSRLVNVPPDAVDREIEQALDRVCEE
jgi:hypothetical protein